MSPPKQPALYIFLDPSLTVGKAAAQAGHAAVEAFLAACIPWDDHGDRFGLTRDLQRWRLGGHYLKLVMDGGSAPRLLVIQQYLLARGFEPQLIVDEGHTEVEPFTPCALGVFVADKNEPHAAATFSEFKLLRPRPQQTKRSWWSRLCFAR
jgi:peptidyl-tRNA hydrolase